MKKWNIILAGVVLLLTVWIILIQPRLGRTSSTPTPPGKSEVEKAALELALRNVTQPGQKVIPAFLLSTPTVNDYQISADGKTALVWVALIDSQTTNPVATEPALAIGTRSDPSLPWQITLPTAANWLAMLQKLPDGLLSADAKALYQPVIQNGKTVESTQALTGYLLPWEGGKRVWLTGSVAHFTTYNSCSWLTVNGDYHSTCRYAFDFSDGTNFRVLAARGGTVLGGRWSCMDNDHGCLNWLALEDRSTNPVTTALYLHLSHNSVPEALRTPGTYVNQGDFIALVDNTGMSTGAHLHFMVVANRWMGSGYGGGFWWGDSVDITFSDVDVNGGRPRLCSEAYYTPQYGTQCHPKNEASGQYYDNWFISGNRGSNPPPTATLSAPAAYSYVYTPTVTVSGTARDNSGVARIQVVANYANSWVEVGPAITTNPFSTNLDLCAAGVPNGEVTLAVWAWDSGGNRSPLPQDPRPIYKNAICPPPTPKCAPNANQVALYTQPDYQGACQVFDVGKYKSTQLTAVGDNQATSLQVGTNVMALLYQGNYENSQFAGRSEAFLANDPGLSDNRIGVKTVSSLEVKARAKPDVPVLRAVVNRLDAGGSPVALTSNDSILLTWKSDYSSYTPDEGGSEYQAVLTLPDKSQRTSPWQSANSWSVGSLAAGNYTWTVIARNSAGQSAATASFSISAAGAMSGATQSVPFADKFDSGVNGWTASGLWHQAVPPSGNTSKAWGFNNGSDYADSKVAGGDLTSPPIQIPAGGAVLKFRYFSGVEGSSPYWDQRRVQVAANGGSFVDVLQLSDDPTGEWLNSPEISLSAYAGMTVRVRFTFHIIDKFNNGGNSGWWIDDLSVNAPGSSLPCVDTSPNESPAQAVEMELNMSMPGVICPAGDVDYYRFSGTAGTTLSIDVVAKAESSALDPYLYLIDGDGRSVLAENDDIQYAVIQDSHISYTLSRSGVYYLKVKAYGHPGAGGANHTYRLVLNGDSQAPYVAFTFPVNNWVSAGAMNLTAYAWDTGGVTRVDFYWHSSDWSNGTWNLVASDSTPVDGWKVRFDPTARAIPGSALMARAYDAAGQQGATVLWNLQTDVTAPSVFVSALPATTQSTVIQLNWSGADAGTGLKQVELQTQDGAGAWTSWPKTLLADQSSLYFMGIAGHTYGFRLRGTDQAGNTGTFPAAAQATTTIATTCAGDLYESAVTGDNTPDTATALPLGSAQEHNFCPSGDTDWLRFNAQAGKAYAVKIVPLGGGASANLTVTDASGQTVLAQLKSSAPGQVIVLKFVAPATGEYRVRIQPYVNGLWGSAVRYSVAVAPSAWAYLPVVSTP